MSLINGLTNQTIDYIYSTSTDGYGDVVETEEYFNVPCRWERRITRSVNEEGVEVSYNVQVWLNSDYSDIKKGWIIKKDGEKYRIEEMEMLYDLEGSLDHIKLYLV